MDNTAFIKAVLDNPDDDAPRLIYADWLDENSQGKCAEFIRAQCALAGMPPEFDADWENGYCTVCGEEEGPSSHYHCTECGKMCGMMGCGKEACRESARRRSDLRQREEELLSSHKNDWLPLPSNNNTRGNRAGFASGNDQGEFIFRRGFIHAATMTGGSCLEHLDDVLACQPVEEVSLTSVPMITFRGISDRPRYVEFSVVGGPWLGLVSWHGRDEYRPVHQAAIMARWPQVRRWVMPFPCRPFPPERFPQ